MSGTDSRGEIADSGLGLPATAAPQRPLFQLLGVARDVTDAQVLESIDTQNAGLLEGVPEGERRARVDRRVRGRIGAHSGVILEIDPKTWAALIDKKVRVGYQMVPAVGQSPVTQCYRCLGFGHLATSCSAEQPTCGYCGDPHDTREWPQSAPTAAYLILETPLTPPE
ncbi:unnamed protein product [Chilo suppressalis]|uniref:CCHC-type domain-containing protein n=1 Tax=Chilo suppressalis TaxID=168631 RepID=A0ABN8BCM2_CHISP|nr:unnamed protein product [Chilo suppressalis]